MRKLIVSNMMSLDGYFAGPAENVMVLPMDQAFDAYNAERLHAADTLLLGRTTYDGSKVSGPPWQMIPTPRPSNGRYHGSITP
jgi:dihydrofolate reductase